MLLQVFLANPTRIAVWVEKMTRHLNIRSKISWGYGLALGVALFGTTAGLLVGNFYEERAREKAEEGHQEGILLNNLQTAVLQARSHQQQFIPLLQRPQAFQQEYTHFLYHIQQVKSLLEETEASVEPTDEPLEIEQLNNFIATYRKVPDTYSKTLQTLLQEIDIANVQPSDIPQAQQRLIEFTNSEIALQFDGLSDNLTDIANDAFAEEERGEKALQRAIILRMQILVGSMLPSMAIAILLAYYVSRAIARPIQDLTQVAKRVTQDSNFDLQVPVTTQDEIGGLATSFNQLIFKVKQLLEQQQSEQAARLLESEKMASLGRMLAGVAHEINNPVNFIYGNLNHASGYIDDLLRLLQTYQSEIPNPPQAVLDCAEEVDADFLVQDLPNLLTSMQVGSERVRQIVLSLKNFSRLDDADSHPVDLHACIDSTLLILNNRLKKDINLVCNYGDVPAIAGYTGLLYQVFMNLVGNAIEALEELSAPVTKTITITTERLNYACVIVRIADNGIGIAAENQAKIFDAFFTTKPRGVGTGLGLAICQQIIVEKHYGTITCHSEVGKGTEFTISLPIQKAVVPQSCSILSSTAHSV